MLLDFHKLVQKHRLRIKGVVHAGAHHGEEIKDYVRYTKNIVLIEPALPAIAVLKAKFPQVPLHEFALGANESDGFLNVSDQNEGQSNSLLEPLKHLEQYPDIKFTSKQPCKIQKLDNIPFDRLHFNMLCMDIQGYELQALKGATWTLGHIDYLYLEVNKDEVYKENGLVSDLDEFLKKWNFVRVETSQWVNNSWGDALYVKKKVVPVPHSHYLNTRGNETLFKPQQKHIYPEDNNPYFEKWYSQNRTEVEGWTYLDIHWTAYYVNNNNRGRIDTRALQQYINSLDKSKNYYTVVQYDDGILNDVSKLNLRVYAMSGKRIDYPLPLICQPHPFKFDFERNILANFIGVETHLIRKEILKLKGQPDLYISSNRHTLESFCHILSTSVFTLCPRGYGQTSFRICEAIQGGSIPVYISNEFIIPHNIEFSEYGILVSNMLNGEEIIDKLHNIDRVDLSILQENARLCYQRYFTFEANKKLIEDDLRKMV